MINFERVTIVRDGLKLFDEITFEIQRNQKVALTGPSGSGKTTLLMAIAGVVQAESGSIFFDSLELNHNTVHDIRQKISFIGQEPALGADTVREAIELPFKFKANRHKVFDVDKMHHVLKLLCLTEDILNKRSSVISGGEKQRIAIARALLLDKEVFLADELTSALDPESKQIVLETFSKLHQTLLCVSHDKDWAGICDRVIQLKNGNITEVSAGDSNQRGLA